MNDLLAELTRIEASLTPGPWRAENPDDSAYMNMYCVVAGDADEPNDERDLSNVVCVTLLQSGVDISIPDKRWDANASGIAALRNLLPTLIAKLRDSGEREARLEVLLRRCDPYLVAHKIAQEGNLEDHHNHPEEDADCRELVDDINEVVALRNEVLGELKAARAALAPQENV